MKHAKSYLCLWITCLIGLAAPLRAADNLTQQETTLLREVRKQPVPDAYSLARLAFVREHRTHYQQAMATWHLIKRLHYNKLPPNQSSAPDHSYGYIADFYIRRLRRKQWLAAHPPRLSNALRRKLAKAQSYASNHILHRESNVRLIATADLDGDLAEEIFVAGRGKRDEPFIYIFKWDGSRYKVVWRAEGKYQPRIFPLDYSLADIDGNHWREITCYFESETDNVARLRFNGTEAIMTWLSG